MWWSIRACAWRERTSLLTVVMEASRPGLMGRFRRSEPWQMFVASPMTVVAACWLAFVVLVALIGTALFADEANHQNLALRFFAPFQLSKGPAFILGGDSLGRPILLQLVIGAQTSNTIAYLAVGCTAILGNDN